ncbi:MAG: hypothetical protein ACRCZF_14920, partial [Gemmataceae bacterium]
MTELELRPECVTAQPIDLSLLDHSSLSTLPVVELEQQPIIHGRSRVPLAELFQVRRLSDCNQVHWFGDLSNTHGIAAGCSIGTVEIHSRVGRHTAARLAGATVVVHGDAGDWLG